MADYQTIEVSSLLPRGFTVVAKASGDPIVSGTVNYYLTALTGANAGKWWRDGDQTWQAGETANAMTHVADGHWTRSLAASPWLDGIAFLEYVKESGAFHIPTSRFLAGHYTPAADASNRVTLAAGGLDPVVVETGLNARQALSIVSAVLAGVLSGANTATITVLGAGVPTTRVVATTDVDDNRTALILSPPA